MSFALRLFFASAICLFSLAVSNAQGQSDVFEVVSIKPNLGGDTDSNIDSTAGGLFRGTNVSLKELIRLAFVVKDFQIAGAPGWIDTERFDIAARTAGSERQYGEQEKQALRALMADRFALKFHRETKELIVYTLGIGKDGPKLTRHDDGTGTQARTRCGHMTGRRVTTAVLATMLSRQLEHEVSDRTGLPGKYDFELDWMPDGGACAVQDGQSASPERPSIFTAVQEQLGLKLESAKGPVEILVIDHVEKPSEN